MYVVCYREEELSQGPASNHLLLHLRIPVHNEVSFIVRPWKHPGVVMGRDKAFFIPGDTGRYVSKRRDGRITPRAVPQSKAQCRKLDP